MQPPPPRTGSIITPARSFFTDSSICSDFSRSLYGRDTICDSSTSPALSDSSNGQFTDLSKSVVYPCQPPSIFATIFLPVRARAILTAYMVASVPVETYLIFSATGTAFWIISENDIVISFIVPCCQQPYNCFFTNPVTCGAAWPKIKLQWPIQ